MSARENPLGRLRRICLALPEAEERETWETPTFRIRDKIFAMVATHEDAPAVWCKAPPGAQAILIGADAERFFRPPYVGLTGTPATRHFEEQSNLPQRRRSILVLPVIDSAVNP